MRKLYLLVILFISLSVISFVGFLTYTKPEEKIELVSPVPDFLSITKNNQVSTLSLWLPILSNFIKGGPETPPEITARSALIYDLTSNKILYEKNPKEKVPMASLTKIMTAIVALENRKINDKYIVRAQDLVGEDSMGLTQGEVLTLDELLYGLILTSGNDAGETIANNYKNGREAFILSMNNKAKALGLEDTNFTNPTGLQGDGDQYTTTYDLVAITRYALTNFPIFRKVASTFEYTIEGNANHKEFYLQNETNLLTSYPGVKGVKTGYTPEAGFCLVTYLDYEGHQIIGVILGSQNRREEMKELLDYSLRLINITPPNHG